MGVEEAFQINAAGFFQAPEYSELPVRHMFICIHIHINRRRLFVKFWDVFETVTSCLF
jgi:hypothetical protein